MYMNDSLKKKLIRLIRIFINKKQIYENITIFNFITICFSKLI